MFLGFMLVLDGFKSFGRVTVQRAARDRTSRSHHCGSAKAVHQGSGRQDKTQQLILLFRNNCYTETLLVPSCTWSFMAFGFGAICVVQANSCLSLDPCFLLFFQLISKVVADVSWSLILFIKNCCLLILDLFKQLFKEVVDNVVSWSWLFLEFSWTFPGHVLDNSWKLSGKFLEIS